MVVVVIAVCARPFVVAAAQAGYKVAALDIFNDVETRRCCFYSTQVRFRDGGFVAGDLLKQLANPILRGATIVYGSGLETQTDLLAEISQRFVVLGNDAKTVASVKTPQRFFALLDRLNISYPETRLEAPVNLPGWLTKSIGGSGGTHIHDGLSARESSAIYFQRYVSGVPIGVLFVADGHQARLIGYHEQWLAAVPNTPFRYGGAVNGVSLSEMARARMADAVRKFTEVEGLRGLNSMDFIVQGNNVFALEINPRLSASFDLYDIPALFDWHVQACGGSLPDIGMLPTECKASLVFYAPYDVRINQVIWPEWVVDIPPEGTLVGIDEPLCSIHARGRDMVQARRLAFARARQLEAQLRPLSLT